VCDQGNIGERAGERSPVFIAEQGIDVVRQAVHLGQHGGEHILQSRTERWLGANHRIIASFAGEQWRRIARAAAEFDIGDAGQTLCLQDRDGVFPDGRAALDREQQVHLFRIAWVQTNLSNLADVDAVVLDRCVEIETGHRLEDDRPIDVMAFLESTARGEPENAGDKHRAEDETNAPTSG
jgi:hypothetical protein